MDEAEAALAGLPEDKAGDPAIAKAKAGIALAKDAAPVDDFDALLAEVAASPDEHEKRFALAAGHVARGDRDAAADALLEIIRRDRAWNEGAATDRLLQRLQEGGLDDHWPPGQRR